MRLSTKQSIHEADGKTLRAKFKAVVAHAAMNYLVLALTTYFWWSCRQQVGGIVVSKPVAGTLVNAKAIYASQIWQMLLDLVVLGMLFFASSIGSALTHNYGVGFAPMIKASDGKRAR